MANKKHILFGIVILGIILVSGCVQNSCGNGRCESGEHSQNCPGDCPPADTGRDTFGIYTALLDPETLEYIEGSMELIASNWWRQSNHVFVSPDREWISFTRYNEIIRHDCAKEDPDNPYTWTEVGVMNLETGEVKSFFKPSGSMARALASWAGERKLIYISADESGSELHHLFLDENMDIIREEVLNTTLTTVFVESLGTYVSLPRPSDPHQVGDTVVFPGFFPTTMIDPEAAPGMNRGTWIMKEDGSGKTLLAYPRDANGRPVVSAGGNDTSMGDNDQHISPDGRRVAFMRKIIPGGVLGRHIFVVDIDKPLTEKDISARYLGDDPNTADGVPTWIDNENLLIWHLRFEGRTLYAEIFTMKADGTERKKVELPDGSHYNQPSLFEKTDEYVKIIFSATRLSDVGNLPFACRCLTDEQCKTHPGGNTCNAMGHCV